MRRSVWSLIVLAVVLAAFYVAWPAWSGRQVAMAIRANDSAALQNKIDFPRVRESLKPVVAAEVTRSLEKLQKDAGPLGAVIAGQLQQTLAGQVVDSAINTVVTAENIIQMAQRGTNLREAMQRAMAGALGGQKKGGVAFPRGLAPAAGSALPAATPAAGQTAQQSPQRRRFGLANIKGYRLTGPMSVAVDVARDPEAGAHDLTVDMRFTGLDWKIVGLTPRF